MPKKKDSPVAELPESTGNAGKSVDTENPGETEDRFGPECQNCFLSTIPGESCLKDLAGNCPECGRPIKQALESPKSDLVSAKGTSGTEATPLLPRSSQEAEPPKKEPVTKRELPRFDDLGPGAPAFEDYFASKINHIKQVQAMMSKALDDHPGVMDQQVRELEAHQTAMKSIQAWADGYLDMAEHQALSKMPSRASDFTDLDRQKTLAAAVVRQRRFRDVVLGIVESMSTRISYAQSRLKAFVNAESQKFQ